ncbi:MAG: Maf family protein, partial [Planctomycetes bacterium]|nr:Maf family protein [Planctomycetota bacterium]
MKPPAVILRCLLGFILLAGLLLPGCETLPVYSKVMVVSCGPRAYLVTQAIQMGEGGTQFALYSTIDPARHNWSAPARYQGEVIGAAARGESALLVFANGSISSYKYAEGVFQVERIHSGKLPLVSVTASGDEILGLNFSATSFQLHRFTENSWQEFGPALQVPGNVQDPLLTTFRGLPCVLWLNRDALKNQDDSGPGPYRIALLADNNWRVEAPTLAGLNGAALAAFTWDNELAIIATAAGEDSFVGTHVIKSASWDGTALTEQTGFAEKKSATTLSGIALAACRDGEGLLGALAADSGIEIFTSPGKGKPYSTPQLLFGTHASGGINQAIVFLTFLIFSTIALTLHLVLKRRRQFEITSTPVQPEQLATPPDVLPGRAFYVPRIGAGGVASPLERALALMIDQILFIPLIWAFLLAQGIDFMELAYLPYETLLEIFQPIILLSEFSFILYAALAEILTGQTLGKKLLGICVRAVEGGRASARRITMRNLIRPLDRFPIPIPFFPALLSMLFSRINQRVGDRVAGTVVTRRVPMSQRRIILASASPRRKSSLSYLGLAFESMAPQVDETPPLKRSPEEVAIALAQRKAGYVNERLQGGEIIIAADTIIFFDNSIIGKPRDREDAREILKK